MTTGTPISGVSEALRSSLASAVLATAMRSVAAPYFQFFDDAVPMSPPHLQDLAAAVGPPPPTRGEDDAPLARICDTVPEVGRAWSADGQKLSELYGFWLDHAQMPVTPLTPDDVQRLEEARSTVRDGLAAYEEARARYEEAAAALNEVLRRTPRDAVWQRDVREARERVKQAETRWKTVGQKTKVESALATVDYYERQVGGLAAVRAEQSVQYERARRTDAAGMSYLAVALRPWPLSDTVRWDSVTIDLKAPAPGMPTNAGGATGETLAWEADDDGPRRELDVEAGTSITVKLDIGYCVIDRSAWFDSTILLSRSWWWAGATPDHPTAGGPVLSNGQPPPATEGELQMTPHGLVVVRNLVISSGGEWTSLFADPLPSGSTRRGFWAITLASATAGQFSSPFQVTSVAHGRIVSRQAHLLGVGCTLAPALPDPDPDLLGA